MHKMIASLFVFLIVSSGCFAATMNVPDSVRRGYPLKFHEAFILQSAGLSTQAFYTFKEAFQEASGAGETPQKLVAME